VEIAHNDCTFGRYEVFRDSCIFVNPGDWVEALKFWIKDKGATHLANHSAYTSEHPTELITKEMNKKDAKKYLEEHKS